MYLCACVFVCAFVFVCACVLVCACVFMCACVYLCVHVCVRVITGKETCPNLTFPKYLDNLTAIFIFL